eukprot:CAMPEP_0114632650 /NCGR_PEP_ID=MMETSP0168-20121206/15044_1 /TAXON_ID=95228 ORGANISM="Vannella sp., Strain DIVA3 517/6/12" /NCGR_SAMPLE_ID=MMETSP0168 /ASSEMBLY_ACC=CAM_ASM_000044 /LENGTH=347 /DNA_ID=CAMNT_0001844267 /DNA_START=58 /DNA_END=1098 /DNA_ORIENTATION=-
MGGKSTYLRQVAIQTIMAQCGMFVPAASASMGVVDKIFSRVGASDDLSNDQSTFMVEMVEMANILRRATPRSLVIIDEIGRGTSTLEGLAIAWAVLERLHAHTQCRVLFATHYHELAQLQETLPRMHCLRMGIRELADGKVVFLHRVQPGVAEKSYGVHVARLAGIPPPVVARAEELLSWLSSAHTRPDLLLQQRPGHSSAAEENTGEEPAREQQETERVSENVTATVTEIEAETEGDTAVEGSGALAADEEDGWGAVGESERETETGHSHGGEEYFLDAGQQDVLQQYVEAAAVDCFLPPGQEVDVLHEEPSADGLEVPPVAAGISLREEENFLHLKIDPSTTSVE